MLAPPRAAPPLWHEAVAFLFLLVGYDRVTASASVRVASADAHGQALLDAEHLLHLDVERWLDGLVVPSSLLGHVLVLYYQLAHVTVTLSVLVAVRVWRPDRYLGLRRALVGTNLVALAVFVLHPVTPPRLLPGAGFVDMVARSGAWGTRSGLSEAPDQYASLPSLHVAWAAWVLLAVVALTRRRALRVLAAANLLATSSVVLLTGNHYVVDVLAGLVLTSACRAVCEAGAVRVPARVQAPVRRVLAR